MGDLDCPKCGTHNLDSAESCRMCGNSFKVREVPVGPSKICQFCRSANDPDAPFCTSCGKYLGAIETEKTLRKEKREKEYVRRYDDYATSAKRVAWTSAGGIVLIIVAAFALVDVIITLAMVMPEYDTLTTQNPALKAAYANLVTCQALRVVFVVLAFMGGFFAIKRTNWGFAIVGGVMCLFAVITGLLWLALPVWALIELVMFLGTIVAVVMVGVSRREFMVT
jgi:ribosomal protein L40E